MGSSTVARPGWVRDSLGERKCVWFKIDEADIGMACDELGSLNVRQGRYAWRLHTNTKWCDKFGEACDEYGESHTHYEAIEGDPTHVAFWLTMDERPDTSHYQQTALRERRSIMSAAALLCRRSGDHEKETACDYCAGCLDMASAMFSISGFSSSLNNDLRGERDRGFMAGYTEGVRAGARMVSPPLSEDGEPVEVTVSMKPDEILAVLSVDVDHESGDWETGQSGFDYAVVRSVGIVSETLTTATAALLHYEAESGDVFPDGWDGIISDITAVFAERRNQYADAHAKGEFSYLLMDDAR